MADMESAKKPSALWFNIRKQRERRDRQHSGFTGENRENKETVSMEQVGRILRRPALRDYGGHGDAKGQRVKGALRAKWEGGKVRRSDAVRERVRKAKPGNGQFLGIGLKRSER